MDGGIFNNGIQMPVQLQKVNEPVDWQHYRIHAAIAAMQGQLANDESIKQMMAVISNKQDLTKAYMELVAKSSVMLADALVAELNKGGSDERD